MPEAPPRGGRDPRAEYRRRAEQIAAGVADQWHLSEDVDLSRLADAVFASLVEEANIEIRQVLTRLRAEFEMDPGAGTNGSKAGRSEEVLAALDRAHAIVDQFLERGKVFQLLLRLEPEEFELASELRSTLDRRAPSAGVTSFRFELSPTWVRADRRKLLDALTHLVARLRHLSEPFQQILVRLSGSGGRVQGFVGLRPSQVRPSDLLRELETPLALEDAQIDMAYARAVVERHDGTLFVAAADAETPGFGFTLPLLEHAEARQ